MIRWRSLDEVTPGFGPSVVTIGNFDGVHRGHQRVFARLLDVARSHHARSVVVTFDPHPALVHRPDSHPGLIMGPEDKLDALEETGVDAVLVLPYSLEFSELTPQQFRVLLCLADGLLNKQIAYTLGLAENTVKVHVTAILKKLECHSRTQAAVLVKALEPEGDAGIGL